LHCRHSLTPTSSKWFLESIGHDGLNNLLAAYEDKSAKAVCTFGYSPGPGHEPILFQGITDGKIVPPRGPGNFGMWPCCSYINSRRVANEHFHAGWDPIFEYEGKT